MVLGDLGTAHNCGFLESTHEAKGIPLFFLCSRGRAELFAGMLERRERLYRYLESDIVIGSIRERSFCLFEVASLESDDDLLLTFH